MRLPDHTDAGFNIAVGGGHETFVNPRVAGKHKPGGGIGIASALLTGDKSSSAASTDLEGKVWIPAKAESHHHVRTELELILSVDSEHVAGFAAAFARALAKGIQVSEQKVSQRKTGELAIEIYVGIHRCRR